MFQRPVGGASASLHNDERAAERNNDGHRPSMLDEMMRNAGKQ